MAGRGLLWFLVLAMCLLVHCGLPEVPEPAQCLVSGIYSLIRAPESQGEQIRVYPKSTISSEQKDALLRGAFGFADETLRRLDVMKYSSCPSETPRFFYNVTKRRCERIYGGCGFTQSVKLTAFEQGSKN